MSTDDIIHLFGGRSEISALTGAKGNAVTQWRHAGIPAKFWHILVNEAANRNFEGITFEVLASTRPVRQSESVS